MLSSSGNSSGKRPQICSGDQFGSSPFLTKSCNAGCWSSLVALGRRARSHVARSALAARYCSRPPLRFTSRDTVEVGRPNRSAINANDSSRTKPREISSRSSNDKCFEDRHGQTGGIPPASRTTVHTI